MLCNTCCNNPVKNVLNLLKLKLFGMPVFIYRKVLPRSRQGGIDGTVLANKVLFAGIVPANNLFL